METYVGGVRIELIRKECIAFIFAFRVIGEERGSPDLPTSPSRLIASSEANSRKVLTGEIYPPF